MEQKNNPNIEVILTAAETEVGEPKILASFEEIAQQEPGNWKLIMEAPLWEAIWERQDTNKWVCIKAGKGFA